MHRVAVIDIGSNSVKLLVRERQPESGLRVLQSEHIISRMGEGLQPGGRMGGAVLERNALAVSSLAARARGCKADCLAAVGTMALRSAANAQEFIDRVQALCGVQVRVLSGDEEARLSYRGACGALPAAEGERLVFDTGGGSTEFVWGEGPHIRKRLSLPLGAVGITESFFAHDPVFPGSTEAALAHIGRKLAQSGVDARPVCVVGVGGTATTLVSVKKGLEVYNSHAVHGAALSAKDVDAQIALYAGCTLAQRRAIPGLPPQRADIMLAGACIVRSVLARLNVSSFIASAFGMRHGLAQDLLDGKHQEVLTT